MFTNISYYTLISLYSNAFFSGLGLSSIKGRVM